MAITKYGDISPRTAAFAVVRLLERGQYELVTEAYGQVDPQGKNKTDTRKYRRYESLARATSPLAEGITPAGQQLTVTDITIQLQQYGDKVPLTDKVIDTHEDNVLMAAMDVVGEQVGETIEVVRINFLKAGTNVFYTGTATTRATVNATISRGDIRRIYRSLRRNKAKVISNIIVAGPNISTEPILPAYFALCSTDLDSDIRNVSGFVPVNQYADSSQARPGEIGSIEQIRFVLTPLFEPWLLAGTSSTTWLSNGAAVTSNANADVYPIIVVARDSYAIVPLSGENSVTPMVHNPAPVVGDELAQKGFVSWKTWQGGGILNEPWVARLETAATALPS